MYQNEKTISEKEIYKGRVVHLTCDEVELENGYKTLREVIHHPGGVCIVALDEDENVYFVKQFRYPFKTALMEIPAGKLEYGEDHLECGKRELKEEIGATAEKMTYLGCIYPTVAYDTEIIHMYMAEGLDFGEQHLDEGEFLDVTKMPLEEAYKMVMENNTVPVIETGTGNCHIYVDADADFDMAIRIILNAKTQRVGVCNACESLVIHESICDSFLPKLYQALREKDVEIHADDRAFLEIDGCVPATEADYGTEYLALKLSVKTVSSLEEAIGHINRYNTGHSEAIITNNEAHARTFLDQVDAACVYVNASTRFTDGFEFGFGAEIGISTQMLHARGPMGLKELTSYKYTIRGNGQTRS